MEYVVPWSALALVIVVGYAASLLTTYLPALRASRVYPAEALRYE
jgi:ABC-type lipoprotein release transport system permease subunit